MSENKRQDGMIEDLHERCDKSQGDTFSKGLKAEQGATTKLQAMQFHIICPQFISMNFLCLLGHFQNSTLEERVELLEGQVVVIQEEVSDIETDVDFLFDEQIIQDERLFSLEEETDAIDTRLLIIDNELEGAQLCPSRQLRNRFSRQIQITGAGQIVFFLSLQIYRTQLWL